MFHAFKYIIIMVSLCMSRYHHPLDQHACGNPHYPCHFKMKPHNTPIGAKVCINMPSWNYLLIFIIMLANYNGIRLAKIRVPIWSINILINLTHLSYSYKIKVHLANFYIIWFDSMKNLNDWWLMTNIMGYHTNNINWNDETTQKITRRSFSYEL